MLSQQLKGEPKSTAGVLTVKASIATSTVISTQKLILALVQETYSDDVYGSKATHEARTRPKKWWESCTLTSLAKKRLTLVNWQRWQRSFQLFLIYVSFALALIKVRSVE